jgi:hypothetical protein
MVHMGWLRASLYVALLVFTFILFVLCCVRINDTLQAHFYEPVIAELLFTSIVTMLWCGLMLCIFFLEAIKFEFLRLYWQEFIAVVILWFLWIGGAAAASVCCLLLFSVATLSPSTLAIALTTEPLRRSYALWDEPGMPNPLCTVSLRLAWVDHSDSAYCHFDRRFSPIYAWWEESAR